MHITLRRYARLGASKEAVAAALEQGLVPLLRRQDGFEGYCAFWTEEGHVVGMRILVDQAAAKKADEQTRRWVEDNKDLFPETPEVFSGSCRFHALAEEREQRSDGDRPLYILVQKLDSMPPLDRTRPISQDVLMPAITQSPGFRGVYMVRSESEQDRSAVAMLFDGKDNAERCQMRFLELMRQHMPSAKARPPVAGHSGVMAARR